MEGYVKMDDQRLVALGRLDDIFKTYLDGIDGCSQNNKRQARKARHQKWLNVLLVKTFEELDYGQNVAFSAKELGTPPTSDTWATFERWYQENFARELDKIVRRDGGYSVRVRRFGGGGHSQSAKVQLEFVVVPDISLAQAESEIRMRAVRPGPVYVEESASSVFERMPSGDLAQPDVRADRVIERTAESWWRFGLSTLVLAAIVLLLMTMLPPTESPDFGIFTAVMLVGIGAWAVDKSNRPSK
jgi:hypothetical protein